MANHAMIEMECRMRRAWLGRTVLHLSMPLVWLGVISGCDGVRAGLSMLRPEYRLKGSRHWESIPFEPMCTDDDDGGYPVQAVTI